jgi:hypothetical protein
LIHDVEYSNPNLTEKEADERFISNVKEYYSSKHTISLLADLVFKTKNKLGLKLSNHNMEDYNNMKRIVKEKNLLEGYRMDGLV